MASKVKLVPTARILAAGDIVQDELRADTLGIVYNSDKELRVAWSAGHTSSATSSHIRKVRGTIEVE